MAGVLGGVLAAERERAWRWALVTWVLAEAFTLLFYVTDTLPATVPVAVALLLRELLRARLAQPDAVGGEVAHGAHP